ncbi:S41 family peptidase [Desulfosporosinus nitroreducens]|uniref:S41 family peptidase n=1 Tax=Desulfosporosinus nitroreducens TaxID=2018668 RepID=A0ABT8QL46_9FIRM|nr:S41 family peptidase [Desulfosporosinus nitroreducens]MCO1601558.1 S41 family peptidase [Desulfosporosinus nitroreducens]MDO0822053.1 S41 family peptidase [Desulfosporosinus nitroreducens]
MQEWNMKRIAKNVGVIFLVFSVLVTTLVSGVVIANVNNVGRLVHVVQLIRNDYLENVSTVQLVEGATKGIVEILGDPYSTYMNAQENQELFQMLEGKFGGIGIVLSLKDPKKLVVLRPIKNSPASRAGIQSGDVISKINDADTLGMEQDKAVGLMRGEPGTKVDIALYRESSNKTFTVSLTRENITVPTVDGQALPGHPDIAYVSITQFGSDTGTELKDTFNTMNITKFKGLILDLRYNHGGELNAAVQVASYFIPEGPVVYIVDKQENVDTKMSTGTYLGMPMVVLVNEESASAAEIVAGAIKDKETASLVGVKTFGKGIVQTIFPLDGGTSVKLTTAKYLTPNKLDIHKKGIEPDVVVELGKGQQATITPQDTNFDAQLQKALQTLQGKLK